MNLKNLLILCVILLTALPLFAAEDSLPTDYININEGNRIAVSVQFPERCMQGDYDFIKEELFFSFKLGGAGLYLSTKALGAKSEDSLTLFSNAVPFRNLAHEVSVFSQEPKTLALTLPKGDELAVILSICKGMNGLASCDGKEVWSYQELGAAYQKNVHLVDGEPRDKIYFKQLLYKKGDKLIFPKSTIGEVNYPLLKKFASESFPKQMRSSATKNVLEKHLEDINKLRSLPVRQENNESLIIRLPLYGKKKCIL